MTDLYKAVDQDLRSYKGFGPWEHARTLTLPGPMVADKPHTYLSASVYPGEALAGFSWPRTKVRLLRVRTAGLTVTPTDFPDARGALSWTVVQEINDWWLIYGPQGNYVYALLQAGMDIKGTQKLVTADTTLVTSGDTTVAPARTAAIGLAKANHRWAGAHTAWLLGYGMVASFSVGDALLGLACRDLLSPAQYTSLTKWARLADLVVHPDD